MSTVKKNIGAEKRQEIKDAFDLFDVEGRERIEAAELPIAMRALGFSPTEDEVQSLLRVADRKNTGTRGASTQQRGRCGAVAEVKPRRVRRL